MTSDPEVTRIVRSWLSEGADRLPDHVLDAVLDRVPATPQRRSLRPAWRLPTMFNAVRLMAVTGTVVAVTLFAVLVWGPRSSGIGGPSETAPPPTPAVSATSTPAPSETAQSSGSLVPDASASPFSSVQSLNGRADVGRVLAAGRYAVADPFAAPYEITLPAGWTLKTIGVAGTGLNYQGYDGSPWINVDRIEGVVVDPCHDKTPQLVPHTVDGFTTALTHLPGFTAGPVTDTLIGDRPAKQFELTNGFGANANSCAGEGLLWLWIDAETHATAITAPGATERISVVDLGDEIALIDAETFTTTPVEDEAQLAGIVETVAFR
jgi:hypothetical protein